MLEAIFAEGVFTVTVTGLTQWDYGQQLKIKGLGLSSNTEVHFSNNAEKEALVMQASASGDDLVVEVPNVLLEKDKDITAWVYTDTGTSGETIRTIFLPVYTRIKPADYVSENNVKEVVNYVEQAQEYAATAQTFANTAQAASKSAQDNADKVQQQADRVEDILENVPDFNEYDTLAQLEKSFYEGRKYNGMTYAGKTSDKGVKLHSVKGKTVQQTTNGYQLFNTSKITNHNGITVTREADGSFTLNGKAVDIYDSSIINTYGSTDIAITSGLKLKANVTNFNIRVIVGNGTETLGDVPLSTDIQDFNASDISWVILRIYNATSVDNLNLKIMLYRDGDGTWEPYTGGKPAPNPDYPMEIKNVEISKIIPHGRQLFDASKLPTKSKGGVTITNNNDGSFTVSGSGNLGTVLDTVLH